MRQDQIVGPRTGQNSFLACFFGAILLITGLTVGLTSGAHPNATPKCDDKVMSPGDVCVALDGSNSSKTYDERLASATEANPGGRIAGVVMAVGGLALLITGFVGIRRARDIIQG